MQQCASYFFKIKEYHGKHRIANFSMVQALYETATILDTTVYLAQVDAFYLQQVASRERPPTSAAS